MTPEQIAEMLKGLQADIKAMREQTDTANAEGLAKAKAELEAKITETQAKATKLEAEFEALKSMELQAKATKDAGLPALTLQDALLAQVANLPGISDHPSFAKNVNRIMAAKQALAEFKDAYQKAVADGRVKVMTTATDPAIVPIPPATEIMALMRQTGMVRKLARTAVPIEYQQVPIVDFTTGSTWAWQSTEGGKKYDHDLATRIRYLTARTAYALVYVSNQLLNSSSPAIEAALRADFAGGGGAHEDNGWINGTGLNGQPLGILNYLPATGINTVPGGGGIDVDLLLGMWAPIAQSLAGNLAPVSLLCNSAALVQLYSAKGTDGHYIVKDPIPTQPGSVGIITRIGGGCPIYLDENILSVANLTSLIMGAFEYLQPGDKDGMNIMANPWSDYAFEQNLTGFRAEFASDMILKRPGAFTVATNCPV